MRLFDRLAGKPATLERDALSTMINTFFGQPDAEKIQPVWANALSAYASSSPVWGVEQARLGLFTEAEFKYQRQSDKGIFGDQSLGLLEKPWPNGSTADLLGMMLLHADLGGNAYVHRISPTRLEMLRPDCVTIVSEIKVDPVTYKEYREVIGFLFEPPVMDERRPDFYPVEDVAHWAPNPDPSANYRGMSWLTPVLREVDADLQLTDYQRAYLQNAATPNLLVKWKDKVSPKSLEILRQRFEARHGGVDNAFRTIVLDEGADVTLLGSNFKDMMITAVQSASENRIAVAGQVPAIVAGLKEGLAEGNYNVYDAALRAFANGTMRRLWRSAFQTLDKLVEVPTGARLWFDEAGVAALRQGEKEQADTMFVLAQAYQALVVAGVDSETAKSALSSGDITLIKAVPGFVSVQMQKQPGAQGGQA